MEEGWQYNEARELFNRPAVLSDSEIQELKWTAPPDPEALIKFLCTDHGFNEKRIRGSVEKMAKLQGAGAQRRMDDFFKVLPAPAEPGKRPAPAPGPQPNGKGKKAKKAP